MKSVNYGDLLDDEEVDVGWVLLKWAVEKCAVRMRGGRKWLRIVVNKRFSSRFSQFCEKRLLASSCLSVRLSVLMKKIDSHWKDFHSV